MNLPSPCPHAPIVDRASLPLPPPGARRPEGGRGWRAALGAAILLGLGLELGTGVTQGGVVIAPARRDVEQGAEVARQVEREIGLCQAPTAGTYLDQVGARLATTANDARWQFRFHIVDQWEPNAFAIPGGGIYVSRGLFALVNREDELAGVLAHEIAHVTQRHSARQRQRGFLPALLSVPGNLVGNVVSDSLGSLINAPVETVGGAWMSRYSRGQESEADRLGIGTAAQAGYDPTALADILERLERDVATQTGVHRRFSIFDSHPMTDTRLRDIRRRTAGLKRVPQPGVAGDAAALFARLDGLWWGENPEAGVFRQDQFLHPVAGFTLTLPAGWKHQNTPQYLISAHPNREAMLLLAMAGPASDPEATGNAFIQRMRKEARLEPDAARRTAIGAFPAFVVSYLDRSGRTPAYLHFGWVTMGQQTYRLIGLGPEGHRETLRDSALSLRPLTDLERRAVTGKRLRIVSAEARESLEELGARSGNAWPPAYTALVNGLRPGQVLDEGRLVKIAREEGVALPADKDGAGSRR